MANKRIRKKWLSRMRKDARKIAKRFKISRQEVGFAISGTIVESDIVSTSTEYGESPIKMLQEYMQHYPTWSQTVDGSIVETITDEGRLLT